MKGPIWFFPSSTFLLLCPENILGFFFRRPNKPDKEFRKVSYQFHSFKAEKLSTCLHSFFSLKSRRQCCLVFLKKKFTLAGLATFIFGRQTRAHFDKSKRNLQLRQQCEYTPQSNTFSEAEPRFTFKSVYAVLEQ